MEGIAKKQGSWQLSTKARLCSGPTSQRLYLGSLSFLCDQSPFVIHGLAIVHAPIQSLTSYIIKA